MGEIKMKTKQAARLQAELEKRVSLSSAPFPPHAHYQAVEALLQHIEAEPLLSIVSRLDLLDLLEYKE